MNDSGATASSSRSAWRINACPCRTGAPIVIVLLSVLSCRCGGTATPGSARFSDDCHVFAIQWAPQTITFFVDGVSYKR